MYRFFDGLDTSLYGKGKGGGIFKKTEKEKEDIKIRMRDKKIKKRVKKLELSQKRTRRIECDIEELLLEKKKEEKLKELEMNLINNPHDSEEEMHE